MKKYIYSLLLLSISWILNSCSSDEFVNLFSGDIEEITISAPDFKLEGTDSRTTINIDMEGAKFRWSPNDTIGIFPNEGRQVDFPMSAGAGTNIATFTGGGWALKSASTYAAYYPLQGKFYLKKEQIPLSYLGQCQDGNNSTSHLGAYDYMGSVATTPENGTVDFQFKHLGALVQLNLPLEEAAAINTVILESNEKDFITKAFLDLTSTPLKITPIETSNEYKIDIKNLRVSEDNLTATVYFMLSPVDLSGKEIIIWAKSGLGDYRFEIPGRNFEEGIAYSISAEPSGAPIPEEKKAMILEAENSFSYSYTITLPKIYGSNITIDWGDGQTETHNPISGEIYSHEYLNEDEFPSDPTNYKKTFEIKISGSIDSLNSRESITGLTGSITGIKQWGASRLKSMREAFLYQPLKHVASDTLGAFRDVKDFSSAFAGVAYAASLSEIPAHLFDKAHNATNFNETFSNTNIRNIPEGLFDFCTKATEFSGTFGNCWGIETIPDGLFDHCPNVTNFQSTFYNCYQIKSIPDGLFDHCPNVTNFIGTFVECSSIEAIPNGLFDYCPNVTNFGGTFGNCSQIKSIPAGLFDHCPNVTNFSSTFRNTGLISIPEGLFDHCPNVTDFSGTFGECSSIEAIPNGLFDHCPNVTNFSTTFGNTGLISIPEGLFDHCPNVTDFSSTFYRCKSLKSVPTNIFDLNKDVQTFKNTFSNCINLAGESPYTEINGIKYHLYERNKASEYYSAFGDGCFYNCIKLTDHHNIPSSWQ